ncbi:uncharacterized [Tachysurus ichikawai]
MIPCYWSGIELGQKTSVRIPRVGVEKSFRKKSSCQRTADITPWDSLKEAESIQVELAVATRISLLKAVLRISPCSEALRVLVCHWLIVYLG